MNRDFMINKRTFLVWLGTLLHKRGTVLEELDWNFGELF